MCRWPCLSPFEVQDHQNDSDLMNVEPNKCARMWLPTIVKKINTEACAVNFFCEDKWIPTECPFKKWILVQKIWEPLYVRACLHVVCCNLMLKTFPSLTPSLFMWQAICPLLLSFCELPMFVSKRRSLHIIWHYTIRMGNVCARYVFLLNMTNRYVWLTICPSFHITSHSLPLSHGSGYSPESHHTVMAFYSSPLCRNPSPFVTP